MQLSKEEYDELIRRLYLAANEIISKLGPCAVYTLACYFDDESDVISWSGDVNALARDAAVQVLVSIIMRHLQISQG